MAVSKDEVKMRLDSLSELKENLVYEDDWRDFKASMASLIVEYSKNPTLDNKRRINSLIDTNFLDNSFVATQAIDNMLLELGISEKNTNNRTRTE